ncbi:hypothetical protein [Nocardia sp. alder85J]|uniref:hypothetical protein n=1 Tax=Nocardia sp. alder85J TaxID=2862949 RepID=UPI001CD63860|nr:hypothetical protein [Nocardia sp. alder85J]MCX4093600.1 hypothetical protein [Nocardia sp. alder85J]
MARKDDPASAGLEAYQRVMIGAQIEQAVRELAVRIGEHRKCVHTRKEETTRLLVEERAAEEAAWAAYEAAKETGAKVGDLDRAGLKPKTTTIGQPRRARADTASEAAARVPLTPPVAVSGETAMTAPDTDAT